MSTAAAMCNIMSHVLTLAKVFTPYTSTVKDVLGCRVKSHV